MKKRSFFVIACMLGALLPLHSHAQVESANIDSMGSVLQTVYRQMIPMCKQLIDVARGLAAFGTTFYIGYRVWRHIANAEPVDFFPLFRPLVMTILIGIFPKVLDTINAILQPTVTATASIVEKANGDVQALLAVEKNRLADPDRIFEPITPPMANQPGWEKYSQDQQQEDSGGSLISAGFRFIVSSFVSGLRLLFKYLLSVILEVIYYAAALCIDTMRIFHLIVLAILGPFVLAFSCYDGFQHSLQHWLARYINVYLWLPVANLFSAILSTIQANMLAIDQIRINTQSMVPFDKTDIAYMLFLVIGTIGYFTVPSITNYIIHPHGGHALMQKVNKAASSAVSIGVSAATGGAQSAMTGGIGGASQFGRSKISGS